jgi:hypothetical protein
LRKVLLVILIISTVFAGEYELKLYEKVLPLVLKNRHIKVYLDKHSKNILDGSNTFIVLSDCTKADILIGKDFSNIESSCKNKPIFATSYRAFKRLNTAFGAFYWRKGRPQIKFNSKRLKELNLVLPTSLKRYAQ